MVVNVALQQLKNASSLRKACDRVRRIGFAWFLTASALT
jgi:hypothetical protein